MGRRLTGAIASVLVIFSAPLGAQDLACPSGRTDCSVDTSSTIASTPEPTTVDGLMFFWGHGCPHCEEAEPFLEALRAEHPNLRIERFEVRRDAAGRQRFARVVQSLGIPTPGVPMFVFGERWVVGFEAGKSEPAIRALVEGRRSNATELDVPMFGRIDVSELPLFSVSLLIGLVDGINPCAVYVLVVLLGLLMRLQSTSRMLLYGSVFVFTSGLVYFGFMAVWFNVFLFVGISEWITIALGIALILMGLTNLKELVWFKKGVSLMIPDRAKPKLFARMRTIGREPSLWLALPGIFALAFVVNLIELGCTIGLPAVFTRILSLHEELGIAERYTYLVLYNVAYVVPLALIVGAFVTLRRRLTMTEQRAKALKVVSGALLLVFGLVFVFFPELLG